MFLDDRELEAQRRMEEDDRSFRMPSTFTISLLGHVALALFLMAGGIGSFKELHEPLPTTAVLQAREYNRTRTRVAFYEVPERAPEDPRGPAELSDADRRAHGGRRDLPPSARPFAPGDNRLPAGRPMQPVPPSAPPAPKGEAREKPEEAKNPKGTPPSLLSLKEEPEGTRRGDEGKDDDEEARKAEAGRRLLPQALASRIRPAPQGAGGEDEQGKGADGGDEGGFVDEEGLSFDTKWFDWGPYGAEMVRRIRRAWRIPDLARVGMKGIVVIRFYILADGRIEDERILRSSGVPPFDNAAFHAIADAAPFPPLPGALGSAREGVTVAFHYNIRDRLTEEAPPAPKGRGGSRSAPR